MSLTILNDLRAKLNKAPLKAWKASKADLALAIETATSLVDQLAFEAPIAEIATQVVRPKHPDASSGEVIREIVTIETPAPKVVAKARKVIKDNTATKKKLSAPQGNVEPFNLADVARQLNIDPKLARVKARRHLTHLQISKDAWTFKATDYDAVVTILTNDQRKK